MALSAAGSLSFGESVSAVASIPAILAAASALFRGRAVVGAVLVLPEVGFSCRFSVVASISPILAPTSELFRGRVVVGTVLVLPGVGFSSQIQPSLAALAWQLNCGSCACAALVIAVSSNPEDKIRPISAERWRFLKGILDSRVPDVIQ
jgi:hypothetical protein